jgi:hypothetical protein
MKKYDSTQMTRNGRSVPLGLEEFVTGYRRILGDHVAQIPNGYHAA